MDFEGTSMSEKKQMYISNMRPVFNRRALFSDTSPDYVIPAEPNAYSVVKIRFRTAKNNVDSVFFLCENERQLMQKAFSEEDFDYYELDIKVDDRPFCYFFEVNCGRIKMYYYPGGADRNIRENDGFRIIPGFKTPDWAKGAVMYQIYVDRFCNGDLSNDVLTNEYFYIGDYSVKVDDWNKYPAQMGVREFYGGDLQGVWDKLDYLQELGIQAIYFNPLFVSPSNHKYDIQDYDYIDPHIAKIVEDEGEVLQPGDHENKNASRYINRVTSRKNLEASNRFFAKLVSECHNRCIKVIIDGVFNHCGSFNKWMDRERIYENQQGYAPGAFITEDSPYHSFFKFYGGSFPYNTNYDGWWGHDTLPKMNYEDSPVLEQYILNIARKWVSPPYNVDGWRLDVAADLGHTPETNHKFWKKFRRAVKECNPDAVIIAEHYGNPSAWLQGDEWDTVMNYDAFMEPVTWFLTGMQKHSDDYRGDQFGNAESFWGAMRYHSKAFSSSSLNVAMNELSNHDHSRFLTRTNHKVGRMNTLGCEAAEQGVDKAVLREAVLMQMTWIGAPTIYYGDEAGVCGFTDPDNRRTYPWGREDHDLIRFHKELIRIRKESKELRTGSIRCLMSEYNVIAYGRFSRKNQYVVVVNNNDHEKVLTVSVWTTGAPKEGKMVSLMKTDREGFTTEPTEYAIEYGHITLTLAATSAIVLKTEKKSCNSGADMV